MYVDERDAAERVREQCRGNEKNYDENVTNKVNIKNGNFTL